MQPGRLTKNIEHKIEFTCDYTVMNEVMQAFRLFEVSVYEREQLLFCKFSVGVPVGNKEAFEKKLRDIRGIEIVSG
jgi:hypothetical protein